MRHLEATILVCDKEHIIELDGYGNVIEVDRVRGIGSGGLFAECKCHCQTGAAEALYDIDGLSALEIARKSMQIAASKCVYTNSNFIVQVLDDIPKEEPKN